MEKELSSANGIERGVREELARTSQQAAALKVNFEESQKVVKELREEKGKLEQKDN